ncbi:MAG: biotin/lipoyl-binding protein [Desulfobulbaceae bacterium]|nr:biotin/lipoyl-binding protein [Desulfobulbaceae bacterium]
MPRSRLLKLFVIVIIASLGFGVWKITHPRAIEVVVQKVAHGTVEKVVANTRAGTLKACREANLSPGVGGQIARLEVREGDSVKQGQLLLELWNKDLTE